VRRKSVSRYFSPEVIARSRSKSEVIPLLQVVQVQSGYVPEEAISEIGRITGAAESDIFSVVTFYKQFRLRPPGKYLIKLCDGTACHVNNSQTLLDVLRDELKLDEVKDTTADGLFTLETVACLGCCSIGPVVMVNDEVHAKLTAQAVRRLLREYQRKGSNGSKGGAA
jgi:NADH-quinone oxidoreductase subunit E